MNLNWLEKYAPKKLEHFIGHEKQKKRFLTFITSFNREKKKAVLLWGDEGTGKTLLPIVAADQLGMEIIEFSASNKRSKKIMEQTLANTAVTASLFGKKKMILVDDADCFTASDRGGLTALTRIIKKTKHPIVLTAKNYWSKKLKGLRPYVLNIHLTGIEDSETVKHLMNICEAEKVVTDEKALAAIAKQNNNDLRACILDMQILSQTEKKITEKMVAILRPREKKTNLKKTLEKMMGSENLHSARRALANSEERFDDVFTWLEENLAHTQSNKRMISEAYALLGSADVFRGRIIRRQYWRFLAYVTIFMAGAAFNKPLTRLEYPRKIRRLFQVKSRRASLRSLSAKLAPQLHTSQSTVRKEYLPLLRKLITEHGINGSIISEYGLTEEDFAFLLNYC